MKKIIAFFIMLLMIVPYSNASLKRLSDHSMYFEGTIDKESVTELMKGYKDNPFKILIIDSGGGIVKYANILAVFIRNNNLELVVNNTCASACVNVFLYTDKDKRHAFDDATLYLHNASPFKISSTTKTFTDEEVLSFSQDIAIYSSSITILYLLSGIPPSLVEKAMKSFGDEFVTIDYKQMKEYGLIK